MISVNHLYDSLSCFVQVPNWLAYRDRYAGLTMHKGLAPLQSATQHALQEVSAVHQLLIHQVDFPAQPKILDAGCGFGGTMFFLHDQLGGEYHGLTLSGVQLRVAQKTAHKRKTGSHCKFFLQSYDAPLTETYDAVLTIESLSHSPNLEDTLVNLSQAIRSKGLFIVIEDMALLDVHTKFPFETDLLRENWACARLPLVSDFQDFFHKRGFVIEKEVDLTNRVEFRPPELLDGLISKFQRRFKWMPLAAGKSIISAYLGGLALEKLYALKAATYRMLVFRKTL